MEKYIINWLSYENAMACLKSIGIGLFVGYLVILTVKFLFL